MVDQNDLQAKPLTAATARDRIERIEQWADLATLIKALTENPSLRGIVMGYVAEDKFERLVLSTLSGATRISKDPDHKKSKSDRRFVLGGREYTIQLKSIQTTSLEDQEGRVVARVQNDASDRRKVTLPTGKVIETTCYLVGEYDILAVPLYPFTGNWADYAYRRNRDLTRSSFRNYSKEEQECLLSTTEKINWPLDPAWTMELRPLLDKSIGKPAG
ncbi:MAG: restriction endonuclease [Thermoplasmata archaeon]